MHGDRSLSQFTLATLVVISILSKSYPGFAETPGSGFVQQDLTPQIHQLLILLSVFTGAMFLLAISSVVVNFLTLKNALRTVFSLKSELSREAQRMGLQLEERQTSNEIKIVPVWFRQVALSWRAERDRAVESSRMEAMGNLARQIAHDIRSPLSALNMALRNSKGECEQRRLAAKAIERINSIANELLAKANQGEATSAGTHEILLPELIEDLIAEKRLEYQDDPRVCVEFRGGPESCGLVTSMNCNVLNRILSNVINNAIEAYEPRSHARIVQVGLKTCNSHHVIEIRDFGRGIPSEVLTKLGKQEVSYGKKGASGSGLGLYDAFRGVRECGGDIQISSCMGAGTKVSIHVPKSERLNLELVQSQA